MKKLVSLAMAAILSVGLLTACEKTEKPAESGEIGQIETNPSETPAIGTITVGEDADFASLAEAVAEAKTLRQSGFDDTISILLLDGEHFVEETVVIDESVPNLTIAPLDGADASVIGGYRVTGWQTDTFNGVDCLSAPVRNEDFTDFYVNGERAKMTRWPAEGTLTPKETDDPESKWTKGNKWIVPAEEEIGEFRNLDRAILSVIHMWTDEHDPIESYDPATGRLTLRYCTAFGITGDEGYWLENVAEMFHNPDEWYVENGRVYYIPRDDSITADTIRAYVPVVGKIIDVCGTTDHHASGVTIRDCTLSVTRGEHTCPEGRNRDYDEFATDGQALATAEGFVSFRYADDCTVENCLLTNYGLYGIEISYGSHRITVDHCTFFDGGGGGIKIIGDEYDHGADATTGNHITDCTIRHCGRRHHMGVGILMIYTSDNIVEHNEICDLFYSGISVGWGWVFYDDPTTFGNLITKNHIHDIGQGVLSDLGAIYTLGSQPDSVISYNLIHDITYKEYGARAFGLDAGTADLTIENNIAYNLGTSAVGCGIGENNVIRNNILFCGGGQVFDDYTQRKEHMLNIEHNIIVTDGKPIHLIDRGTLSQKLISSSNNLIYDISGQDIVAASFVEGDKTWTLEQMQKFFGLEEGSIAADPGFADLGNHDFTLAEDSPAYDIGFVPFDLSDVGPRK